jgi:DNA modification methylase
MSDAQAQEPPATPAAPVPAPTVEHVPISSLTPCARNSRKHTRKQIEQIAESIRTFGFLRAVVVDAAGEIVAGHASVLAAERAGLKTVPVLRAAHLTPEQRRAFLVADNALAERSRWDKDLLLADVQAILAAGIPADAFGFSEQDLARLMRTFQPASKDPGAMRQPDCPTRVSPGDRWTLGQHTLVCGDAQDPATVERATRRRAADLVWLDPPYNVDNAGVAAAHVNRKEWDGLAGDAMDPAAFEAFIAKALQAAAASAQEAAAWYVCHASASRRQFERALDRAGLVERQYITWVKDNFVQGRQHYHWQTEPIFYAARAGQTPAWYGGRDQTTVWRIDTALAGLNEYDLADGLIVTGPDGHSIAVTPATGRGGRRLRTIQLEAGQELQVAGFRPQSDAWRFRRDPMQENIHPTQKPVALVRRAIENHTLAGGLVLDTFAGSGSTVIAAEQTGRRAAVVEISPKYASAIVERWEQTTGQEATRED